MKFDELIEIVGKEPVFSTALLLAGDRDPDDVRRQLSRWCRSGKLNQLRRGLYSLAQPYQKVVPHPFLIANRLVLASYVSLQSALSHAGLVPEYVPWITSVTTKRPANFQNSFGQFAFRHIQPDLFWGYEQIELGDNQVAFVATAEKALLDLIYLEPNADQPGYLDSLRLQNLGGVDLKKLVGFAARSKQPKLQRAAAWVCELAKKEDREYETI